MFDEPFTFPVIWMIQQVVFCMFEELPVSIHKFR